VTPKRGQLITAEERVIGLFAKFNDDVPSSKCAVINKAIMKRRVATLPCEIVISRMCALQDTLYRLSRLRIKHAVCLYAIGCRSVGRNDVVFSGCADAWQFKEATE